MIIKNIQFFNNNKNTFIWDFILRGLCWIFIMVCVSSKGIYDITPGWPIHNPTTTNISFLIQKKKSKYSVFIWVNLPDSVTIPFLFLLFSQVSPSNEAFADVNPVVIYKYIFF